MKQTYIELPQLDGNHSFLSTSSTLTLNISDESSLNSSEHNVNGEILSECDPSDVSEPTYPPAVSVINARSLYNKPSSLKTLLKECNIDIAIISETWERDEPDLQRLLSFSSFTIISKKRPGNNVGGGVAIIAKLGYSRVDVDLSAPSGVEVIWTVFYSQNNQTKKFAVAAVYVPPRSRKKAETTEFLISSVFLLLAKFDKIKFIICGDINNLDIKPITDAVPVLKQIVDKPTHNNRILDVIITDMKELYYPPFVKPPLENDDDLQGQPSEHKVVILIPNSLNINNNLPEKRRI